MEGSNMKFIEVTVDGKKVALNVEHIISVEGSIITTTGMIGDGDIGASYSETIKCNETYTGIMKKIKEQL
jgi:hypothetical protein